MPALKKRPEQLRSEAITKSFKKALIEKGWTQDHLGKLLGIDRATICRVINNPLKHDFSRVLLLSDKLGVKLLSDEICEA